MTFNLILKYLLSAAIITLVSETVKRSDKAGALLAALPFVSIITLFWVHYESAPEVRAQKTADHMWYILVRAAHASHVPALPCLPALVGFLWCLGRERCADDWTFCSFADSGRTVWVDAVKEPLQQARLAQHETPRLFARHCRVGSLCLPALRTRPCGPVHGQDSQVFEVEHGQKDGRWDAAG